MKTLFKMLIVATILFCSQKNYAQDKQKIDTMPFQLSLISPLGTNGMHSFSTVNNFSINIYAGIAAGLDGFEASGFLSVLKGDMRGAQFSGFVNADLGRTHGAQFAGFVNYNKEELEGFQAAGFVNVVTKNTEAVQLAGFVNTVVGEFEGAQFAGFVNVATKESKGAQFAGFVNTTSAKLNGFQGAGFTNYAQGITMGQISGFLNTNKGDLNGIQATGFLNLNTGRVKGAQLAGFLNITKQLNGTQIGMFNYVDSLESGTPIGFLSFVKNGYRAFELRTSETLFGIASFKTGTKKFYNIISAGGAIRNNTVLWGMGYGIGTMHEFSDKISLNIELQSFQLSEGDWRNDRLNLFNTFSTQLSYEISEGFRVFAAPTFNVIASDTKNEYGEPNVSNIAPFNIFSETYDNIKVEMYPGFTLGVTF